MSGECPLSAHAYFVCPVYPLTAPAPPYLVMPRSSSARDLPIFAPLMLRFAVLLVLVLVLDTKVLVFDEQFLVMSLRIVSFADVHFAHSHHVLMRLTPIHKLKNSFKKLTLNRKKLQAIA